MHNVTVKRYINHSAGTVWNVLDDFGGVYKYNPGVDTSEILGDELTGIGAKRICRFTDGNSLKETITHYTPNHGYSFSLSEFALPLKQANSHFNIEPAGDGRSELTITLEFQPKFGPVGWLMAKLLIRPTLRKALNGITQGLDDHLTSGKIIGVDGQFVMA